MTGIGVARTLKKLRTSKLDYWIKQLFSSIASLFKMGTSLKGKNLQREQILSFMSSSLWYGKSFYHIGDSFECCSFFYYARVGVYLRTESYANGSYFQLDTSLACLEHSKQMQLKLMDKKQCSTPMAPFFINSHILCLLCNIPVLTLGFLLKCSLGSTAA